MRQRVAENRLPVAARAVHEKDSVLACLASQAVARHSLKVPLELNVAARDFGQELLPARAVALGLRGCLF
jgi:hypothetical protein